jgi:hypothetical protein
MDTWIYIIIFVIVPIINRIIEMKKARAEKAAAEAKRMMRKEARDSRRASRSPSIEVTTDPAPPPVADDSGWQTVETPLPVSPEPEPFEPIESTAETEDRGMWTPGGWVELPETATDPQTGLPLPPGVEVGGSGSVPGLEIFDLPVVEEIASSSPSEPATSTDAFELEPSESTAAYQRNDVVDGIVTNETPKNRLRLTRSQLRDRLIWREILGPPLSMREEEI